MFLRTAACGAAAASLESYTTAQGVSAAKTALNPDNNSVLCEALSLKFLGTGAADWSLDQYPDNPDTLLAGRHRGFSSMLINGSVLIDCGPTVPKALSLLHVHPDSITDILITHTHGDHFNRQSIETIASRRSADKTAMNVWMHENAARDIAAMKGCFVRPVKEYAHFRVQQMDILPLEANHRVENSTEKPLYYLFKTSNKSLLYALDGAWLTTRTWRVFMQEKLDAVVWDATIGKQEGDYRIFEHNSLSMIRQINQTLSKQKIYAPDAKIILSHLARSLHPEHAVLKKELESEGMLPAHDGLDVNV
ncbi:MAG: MBL fold metallo-hydrolase [Anaerohalosphaeraceae bacterium]